MNSLHYYNDSDPHACHRLRSLISAGLIPAGHVDDRSITDVRPEDLQGYTQCHFFAGIGGWSRALFLAGIPETMPVWTGSCPCQPFSVAGKRKGTEDERHLWPVFRDLIAECHPPAVFGEQVASADGRAWLSVVRSEMEALGYAVGAADLCAAGIGAPHPRQRLYFVGMADTDSERHNRLHPLLRADVAGRNQGEASETSGRGKDGWMADADGTRSETIWDKGHGKGATTRRQGDQRELGIGRIDGGLADADSGRLQQRDQGQRHLSISDQNCEADIDYHADEKNSFWGTADWLFCRDGKWRPVEPGTQPLAHGLPGRVAHLRGYGNAIVPQIAATFIRAALNLP